MPSRYPKPTDVKWTDAQWDAITAEGGSVLVSAAAGSGKTSVLAERCVWLLTHSPQRCDVDQLLVVTFTESAAAEMRARINKAIADALKKCAPGTREAQQLRRQLALVGRAQISTIHGFCARLIRQNFQIMGLDPAFAVLDGEEAGLLIHETAEQIFEDRYTQEQFRQLIDLYGSGSDSELLDTVIRIHNTLGSLVDPDGWRRDTISRLTDAANKPLAESELGQRHLAQLKAFAGQALDLTRDALEKAKGSPKCEAFAANLHAKAADALGAIEAGRLDLARDAITRPSGNRPSSSAKEQVAPVMIDVLDQAKVAVHPADSELAIALSINEVQARADLQTILPHAGEVLELTDLLGRKYNEAKRGRCALDFADLERMALTLLRDPCSTAAAMEPTDVALECHRRYHHVLVDEYQDVNDVQNAILRLVSRECLLERTRAADEPTPPGLTANLFAVGDVKQSIYRFRLAEPQLFLDRRTAFAQAAVPFGESIDLQSNFRSRAPLLESINAVFARLMTGGGTEITYDKTQQLVPGAKYPTVAGAFHGAPVELSVLVEGGESEDDQDDDAPIPAAGASRIAEAELTRAEREAQHVGRLLREILGCDGQPPRQVAVDKDSLRPIRPGDVVILLRTMRGTANIYVRQLARLGISAMADSRSGFFEAVEVADILSILRILDNQRQDIPLAALLRSPLAGISNPDDVLAKLRLHALKTRPAKPFHEAVADYVTTQHDPLAGQLGALLKRLEHWRQMSRQRPVDEVLWAIYHDTGYMPFCAALPRGNQRVGNLMELHRRARQFAARSQQGLFRFLQFIDRLAEQSDVGEAAGASVGDDTVRIMSVHQSKGLEFPVVIIPDLAKRFNLSDARGSILVHRKDGLGLQAADERHLVRYPTLASRLISRQLKQASVAEELRVLYVAMTRAKEHLILVGSVKPTKDQRKAGVSPLDAWRESSTGPIAEAAVLGASSMIQWLGPLSATSESGLLTVQPADFTEVTKEEIERFAARREAEPAATPGGAIDVQPLTRRLEYQYPYTPFTRLRAGESVTGLSKSELADHPGTVAADPEDSPVPMGSATSGHRIAGGSRDMSDDTLPSPSFLAESGTPASAADRGIATHAVLQYLDFATADTTLQQQIGAMVQRHQLTPQQAQLVDLDSIRWLLASEIGELLKKGGSHRELPFYFPAPPPIGVEGVLDAMDHIMVRGRLDAIVPTPEGLLIIDYKTDRAVPAAGSERAMGYQKQCGFYRQAIEGLGVGKVAGVRLVFLVARAIVDA